MIPFYIVLFAAVVMIPVYWIIFQKEAAAFWTVYALIVVAINAFIWLR